MTKQIDVAIPRFNQACVAALTALAFVLGYWPIVAAVFVVLALSRFVGPAAGLFTQIYIRLIRHRRREPVITEPVGPPRFAQLLGVLFLGAATVLFVLGFSTLGWIVTLLVTALATLAATAKICVGCILYEQVAR